MIETGQQELAIEDANAADLYEQAGPDAVPRHKWASLLAELVDVLFADLRRQKIPEEKALPLAQRMVLVIAEHNGGRQIYLPRGDALKAALRDRAIYLEARGDNADELADRYGLTTRHIQRIVAEQRALYIRKHQRRLFDDVADAEAL